SGPRPAPGDAHHPSAPQQQPADSPQVNAQARHLVPGSSWTSSTAPARGAPSTVLPHIEQFPFLDKPDAAAVHDGYETLFELGAITEASAAGTLTEVGQHMARVPVDPRIARMMLGAQQEGALDQVLILAAILSIQDPRERPMSRQDEADRAQAV